jgi:hypothetical protein
MKEIIVCSPRFFEEKLVKDIFWLGGKKHSPPPLSGD